MFKRKKTKGKKRPIAVTASFGLATYPDDARSKDDLIRLALEALQLDGEYLKRLQARWPYILEDEAQDSSRLQEEILRLLAGESGNWVRVGDPNQAIYETFTTEFDYADYGYMGCAAVYLGGVQASMAVSGGAFFVRTDTHLYRIAAPQPIAP